jgi:hypothetical protein
MEFVFARGEINRGKIPGRDLAVDGHGKGGGDKGSR